MNEDNFPMNLVFKALALSFPNTEQAPHFDRTSFKLIGKRIFATMHNATNSANLRLSPEDQLAYISLNEHIYPVPNKWGEQGWTTFELANCEEEILKSALESAYLHAKNK